MTPRGLLLVAVLALAARLGADRRATARRDAAILRSIEAGGTWGDTGRWRPLPARWRPLRRQP